MTGQPKQFEVIEESTIYHGFFDLIRYKVKHTLFQGGWSQVLVRELFQRGNCVAVVLYDPVSDQVVLIEQFRVGAIKSRENQWLLEIVAGAIEPGELPREVALREAKEEAGCEIQELIQISEFYTSPGGSSEKITLYCGKVDASNLGGVHGLDHEDEDILVSVVSLDEALEKIETGEIESAIPIIALQWLGLNRMKLRDEWDAAIFE
jgi:ADP-ribose pyrophosphatase